MYQDDFCGGNSELLSRHFLQKSQIYNYITPQIIALFRSNYILSSFDLCYVQAIGHYTRGKGRKPKLREGRRNERHKSSEKVLEK